MSVYYKFKSAIDYDTITFDGLHISVGDLKKAIIHQKHLGRATDFDLQITNAQTNEAYTDEAALIAKNTSLIVARVPVTGGSNRKTWERTETTAGGNVSSISSSKGVCNLHSGLVKFYCAKVFFSIIKNGPVPLKKCEHENPDWKLYNTALADPSLNF